MSWFWTWANQHNKTIQVWHYDSHVVLNKLRWISTAHVDGIMFGTRIHVLQSRTSATVYKYYYCTNQLKITKVVVLYCYSNYFNNIYGQLYVRFTNIEKINKVYRGGMSHFLPFSCPIEKNINILKMFWYGC